MKKTVLLLTTAFAFLVSPFASKMGNWRVEAAEEWSETLVGRAMGYYAGKAELEGKDAYVSPNGKYEYFIRHGRVETKEFARFDTITASSVTSYSIKSSISTAPSLTNWQATTSTLLPDTDKIIFGFRAIEAMSWQAKETQLGGWVTNTVIKFYVHRSGTENPSLVASQEFIKSDDVLAATSPIALRAGDIAYCEWGKTPATTSTRNMQTSQAGSTGYPEFIVGSPEEDEVNYGAEHLLSNAVASLISGKGSTFDHPYISGGFYHGSPQKYDEFTQYYGDGTGISTDSLATSKNENLHLARFQRWQVNCGTADDAIIRIKAKYNMKISALWSTDSDSGITTWADKCSIRFYQVSSSGDLHFVKAAKVVKYNKGKEGEYDFSTSIKAGESILIAITSGTDAYQTINYKPVFVVSQNGYEEGETFDFSSSSELEAYKVDAAYTNGKKARWYSDSKFKSDSMLPNHYSNLQDIYLRFCRQVDAAMSKAEIDSLYNAFLTEFVSFGDAAVFVCSYLHFQDYDPDLNNTEGTMACKTYYSPAKAAFNALSAAAKTQLKENACFSDAKARLAEWGGANRDIVFDDYSLGAYFSPSKNDDTLTSAAMFALCFSAFALLTILLTRRLRKNAK